MAAVVEMKMEPAATPSAPARNVYEAIGAVMADLARHGIGKHNVNESQKYKFRGIDDVYNALSPAMTKAGLVVLPRMLTREVTERTTAKGGVLFYVTVEAEFDFVSVADGSKHIVRTFGEAMDSGDKATNKAMSAAFKYAAFQAFCIPTEGDNDADATTHTVVPKAPEGYADWREKMESDAVTGPEALRSTWSATPAAIRSHANKVDREWLNELKETAAKVGP